MQKPTNMSRGWGGATPAPCGYLLNYLVGRYELLLLAGEALGVVGRVVVLAARHLVPALHEGQLPTQARVFLSVVPAMRPPAHRPAQPTGFTQNNITEPHR